MKVTIQLLDANSDPLTRPTPCKLRVQHGKMELKGPIECISVKAGTPASVLFAGHDNFPWLQCPLDPGEFGNTPSHGMYRINYAAFSANLVNQP